MADIVDHAFGELMKLGMTTAQASEYVVVIASFKAMTIPDSERQTAAQIISDLLFWKNLTPLTDDPAEWQFLPGSDSTGDPGIWQSKRNPEVFSPDGGKTYIVLGEVRATLDSASPKHKHISSSKLS